MNDTTPNKKEKSVNSQTQLSPIFVVVGAIALLLLLFLAYWGVSSSVGSSGRLGSSSAETEFEAGNDFFQAGQLAEAVEAYKRAIALRPGHQAAYVNLGVAYYQQEEFDLAEAQYRKALELNPNDGEVAYNLGALYLQQALLKGEPPDQPAYNKAVEQLEQALYLAPDLAEPHFSLGVAYQGVAENQKAIEAFQKFLDLNPVDQRAVEEAQRYLANLQSR